MSIARTVIRLEVTDNSKLPDLFYEAEDVTVKNKPTYAEVTDHEAKGSDKTLTVVDPIVLQGKRKYSQITIETFMAQSNQASGSSLFEVSSVSGEDPYCPNTVKGKSENSLVVEIKNSKGKGRSGSVDMVTATGTSADMTAAGTSEVASKKKKTVEPTISGALKNPLNKSHSIDYSGDSPRGVKVSPRSLDGACFTPVNLDLEEAKSLGAKGQSPIPDALTFFSGNPSVETTEGIIHLYKENKHIPQLDDDVERGELICMLRVPTTLTSQDLIHFIGPVAEWVEHIKVIRDTTPNYYMVLLKFDCQKHADEFYKNFNGKAFNSIEPAQCHLVYVAKLESMKSSDGAGMPIPGLTELPVCPVCLERMDESVDGILTILCNHSFHTLCLSHWDDTSCPVCRYTQTPESVADNKCFECNAEESLWICLICGYVGCGRYVEGHAFKHFQVTNHTFSMQLGNNRVWDYAGDNYVHRLVQNKSDGKMVQVGEDGLPCEGDEKLDSITLEYTYLLNTQLESQRHYFEEKLSCVEAEAVRQLGETDMKVKVTRDKCLQLEDTLSVEMGKRKVADKKCEVLSDKYKNVLSELGEEREMNKNLCENQTVLKSQIIELQNRIQGQDTELRELRDQLRDVMIFLDAQQKLSSTAGVTQEEIQDSTVMVGQTPNTHHSKKSRKKGR